MYQILRDKKPVLNPMTDKPRLFLTFEAAASWGELSYGRGNFTVKLV